MLPRNRALRFASLILVPLLARAESADRYPEIRRLILAAETASVGIVATPTRSNPFSEASRLYARAGYLEDAIRASAKAGDRPEYLAAARALYGDLDGALKLVTAITDL